MSLVVSTLLEILRVGAGEEPRPVCRQFQPFLRFYVDAVYGRLASIAFQPFLRFYRDQLPIVIWGIEGIVSTLLEILL